MPGVGRPLAGTCIDGGSLIDWRVIDSNGVGCSPEGSPSVATQGALCSKANAGAFGIHNDERFTMNDQRTTYSRAQLKSPFRAQMV